MIDLHHLRNKTVIVKLAGTGRAVNASVMAEEESGLWLVGGSLIGELAQAGLPTGLKSPAVFVPFSHLQYLIAENE